MTSIPRRVLRGSSGDNENHSWDVPDWGSRELEGLHICTQISPGGYKFLGSSSNTCIRERRLWKAESSPTTKTCGCWQAGGKHAGIQQVVKWSKQARAWPEHLQHLLHAYFTGEVSYFASHPNMSSFICIIHLSKQYYPSKPESQVLLRFLLFPYLLSPIGIRSPSPDNVTSLTSQECMPVRNTGCILLL